MFFLAKPPAAAHEWLIQLGRLCDAKPTASSCQPMAEDLGIDPLTLINLVGNSKTQTARNIIHSKLTIEQKLKWNYTNIPEKWRRAIHSEFLLFLDQNNKSFRLCPNNCQW